MTIRRAFIITTILMLVIIASLCCKLFSVQNENNILNNELDTTKSNCDLLVDKHSSTYQELTEVKNKLEEAKNELLSTQNKLESTQNELDEVKAEVSKLRKENLQWSSKYNQYPTATIIWIYMTEELGWSDVVVAGIIGNMMAECGGHTLNLDWDINDSSGYGLIQWLGSRRKDIKEKYGELPTIIEQIEFIKDELYGTNGVERQVTDSQLNAIINAETPEDCAFAFASYYERCSENHRAFRRGLARTAYNYFTN